MSLLDLGVSLSNRAEAASAESLPVIRIVPDRQLRIYGQIARFPDLDPAYRLFFYEPTLNGGDHSWGKLTNHAGSGLEWER